MRIPNVGEEFGRYRLDRVVGQGGMGIVFAATDQRLQRTVALKVITAALAASPEFRARFQAEAAALARLDSPYVIAIHDHDEIDGTPYIVTQFVDGTDLWSLLESGGPLPARQAVQLCAQVARGLADAHRVGVIHRDVKPGNVLIRGAGTRDAHAYLCDFGIARADGVDAPAATAAGSVAGTWSYLSPERADGAPATASSDIYALGCVLWACLTGRTPYQGSDVQMVLAHQQAPIPRAPGAGPFTDQLNEVIERALAKDPAERYPDASALRADLERLAAIAPDDTVERPVPATGAETVVAQGSVPRQPPPPPPPVIASPSPAAPGAPTEPAEPGRRRRWPLLVAALVVLAMVGALTTWLAVREDSDDNGSRKDREPAIAGDVDGDGRGDLLIHQIRLGATITPLPLWRVPSTGKQFGSPEPGPGEEGSVITADTDGDGATEVLWLDDPEDEVLRVHVVPADGDDRTIDVPIDPAFDIKPYRAEAGDVNGDGRDDLVLVGDQDTGDSLHVALADGDGFADPEQWYRSEASDGEIWTGDFDGDGTDEVLYWADDDDVAGTMTVLSGKDGDFTETASRDLTDPVVDPTLANWTIGDVDGDGVDEIGILGFTDARYFVHEVDGGTIAERTVWWQVAEAIGKDEALNNALSGDHRSVGLSDVDGDGDADLVQIRDGDDEKSIKIVVHLSDGTAFDEGQVWGSLACEDQCTDGFVLVP